jgi:hypothetical protein
MENASNGMWLRLFESLIGSESHDGQSKGINGKLVVLYVLPEDVSDTGGPTLPFHLGVVSRIAEHFHELNPSRIGGLSQIVKDNLFDFDIDVWKRAVLDVSRNHVVLAFLVNDSTLNIAAQW